MSELAIPCKTKDSVINVVLEALDKGKQVLVFVGTRRSAERVAENIAKALKNPRLLEEKAESILSALSKPTKQCERLASIIISGIAFHHAGLAPKQKDIVEQGFREREVKVIACTPTLAYGLDLPAYRVIIRDVKRYGEQGMGLIPVLDYLQMAGRAGRPSYDDYGEAVLVSDNEGEARELWEHYVEGSPEDIYSKLAVEPVLRTHVLSLIATRIVRTREELLDFFGRTFWAHQYKDMDRLSSILDRMLGLLTKWGFVEPEQGGDFVSASDISDRYKATIIGSRVAQLYLDPLTARRLMDGMEVAEARKKLKQFAILHLICRRLEMRPLLRVGVKEWEDYQTVLASEGTSILEDEPDLYDPEYDDFICAVKTAAMMNDWMEERTEDLLLERFKVTPGELHNKLNSADWLLYACCELASLTKRHALIKEFSRVRFRLKYGVKEELLPLLQIKQVGRIRARIMFNAGIKNLGELKKADLSELNRLLGKGVAARVKKAIGEDVPEPIPEKKRKGQLGLARFT